MNALFKTARALDAIRARQNALTARRQEIERRARAASKRTQIRARHLMSQALLTLLQSGDEVTPQTLERQIDRQACGRDRFAVELCGDWLLAIERQCKR